MRPRELVKMAERRRCGLWGRKIMYGVWGNECSMEGAGRVAPREVRSKQGEEKVGNLRENVYHRIPYYWGQGLVVNTSWLS